MVNMCLLGYCTHQRLPLGSLQANFKEFCEFFAREPLVRCNTPPNINLKHNNHRALCVGRGLTDAQRNAIALCTASNIRRSSTACAYGGRTGCIAGTKARASAKPQCASLPVGASRQPTIPQNSIDTPHFGIVY